VPESRKKNDLDLAMAASLGLELAVWLGLAALLGHFADKWLDTSPLMLLICCGLGLAAGLWRIVSAVSDLQARGPRRPGGNGVDERTPPRP